ncbi:MAG TPA: flagellar hook-associated protein FlgK [Burkholderiaceae bacterium]|nr:flagellar hook-associated protein FlgK [Burkholderiaceae bacterium]
MTDLLRLGTSALNAAYAQLQTTGHNIANAATPGYSRREVVLQDAGVSPGAGGFFGRGVDVANVRRVYDQFLARESIANDAAAAQDRARSAQLDRLNALFADPATGVGAAFDELVGAFGDVAARPNDASVRTVALARADAFANRVRSVDQRMSELAAGVNSQMQNDVRRANDALAALAALNRQLGEVRGSGREPSDLLDRRDQLLAELNGVLRAPSHIADDGTVTVQTVRGEPLLVGTNANRLLLAVDPMQPEKLQVALELPGAAGGRVEIDAAALGGGTLAGLVAFRDQDLASARARLGQLAGAVADAVNRQQSVGLDARGAPGAPMFSSAFPQATASPANAGAATLSVELADGAQLRATDYRVSFDGSQYTVMRTADGSSAVYATLPQTVDGLTLQLAGAPQAGDEFFVRAASGFAAALRAVPMSPEAIATAMPITVTKDAASPGGATAALRIDTVGPGTTAPVTITFTGAATFDVSGDGTGNPTGIAYVPGMTVSFNGWTATLSGAPAAGDTLRIVPTAEPGADNRNARLLQGLGTARLVDGGSVIDRYAELIGDLGSRAQSVSSAASMSQRIAEDSHRLRSEISGVNLDEEAARLLQYQQAYQAAAKVIRMANDLFETLLASSGR